MKAYRYELDSGSKKHKCPSCQKKRFVRYVDQTTGNYLPSQYGRCDREVSCTYFNSPYDDHTFADRKVMRIPKRRVKPTFIRRELYKKSLTNYGQNNFVRYLHTILDKEKVSSLIKRYHLGTSTKLKGGCIFYQLDLEGNIRRGKIIVYNPRTGRRGRINSVHSLLGVEKQYYPEWRFFGEHLLIDKTKPVAIVEAEKTAIIASTYFPEFIWLATGMKATLKLKYAWCLKDRNVTLFPDLGAFDDWEKKVEELLRICTVSISDILELNAEDSERERGLDLADYLTDYPS